MLIILLCAYIQTAVCIQGGIFNLATANLVPSLQGEPEGEIVEVEEGATGSKVVIERIVSYPATGLTDVVVLRNAGGQTADLTGWSIADDKLAPRLFFGEPGCEGNATIPPQESLILTPLSADNLCGFPFGISFRDFIVLIDDTNTVAANVSWDASEKGSAVRLIDEEYLLLPEQSSIIEVIKKIDQFSIFIQILEATGLDKLLDNDINPDYTGILVPSPPSPDFNIEFPWWFGFRVDRTSIPPPPPPPPPPPSPPIGQIPELGPYTVIAPTNDAFNELLRILGGGRVSIPLQALIRLPELEDIVLYHIMYGDYTTDYMFNNTGIKTTLGPEVVAMKDPKWTEGQIALNDACVDKPTTGYPCNEQLKYNKCFEPFMISPLAAGWQGGFCQKTCQRCTCDPEEGGTCAMVLYPDIIGGNGVVHGISRVLFPPPMFDESVEGYGVPLPEVEDIVLAGSTPSLPSLPSLPQIPGNVVRS